ncbi:toll/interleukin-1 receptor domain-containing protein [Halioxenophilus aromaticivorans]|uniref:TIR domain-containing protein n=1 Tax=Halioxenophilus aromaticivorans TaxID=1306992 RepID=A0AAV3TZ27_9ALTE
MKVFISHTNEDAHIAIKIRNYLVHSDIDVFDDKADISMGSNLASSINEAIDASDAVLFIISRNTDKSRWVHQEMSLAISNKLNGKSVKLIPIVVEKNSEIPFFLKDYLYLDLSRGQDFETGMSRLIEGLRSDKKTSIQQDLEAKVTSIEIEKELLKIKSLEHEEFRKFKSRQMFFIAMIATLVSSVVVSIGLLGWVAKIEYSNFEWIIAFLVGAMASMLGSLLYMRKDRPHKDELVRKIDELHNSLKEMEARHDK